MRAPPEEAMHLVVLCERERLHTASPLLLQLLPDYCSLLQGVVFHRSKLLLPNIAVACFVMLLFSHSVPLHMAWGRIVLDLCMAEMEQEKFPLPLHGIRATCLVKSWLFCASCLPKKPERLNM